MTDPGIRLLEVAEGYQSGVLPAEELEPFLAALRAVPGVGVAALVGGFEEVGGATVIPFERREDGSAQSVALRITDAGVFEPHRRLVELAVSGLARARRAVRAAGSASATHPMLDGPENAWLAAVARNTQHAVMVLDADHRVVWVNDAFTTLLGFTLPEIRGRSPREFLYHGEVGLAAADAVRDRVSLGEHYRGEIETRSKDGRSIWSQLEVFPFHGPDGAVAGYVSLRVDVTARRQMQGAILDSEARFRVFMEISADWYWETDASGRYTALHGSWPTRYADALIGQDRLAFLAELIEPETFNRHLSDIANRRPFKGVRFRSFDADGNPFWASTSGRPVFAADGSFQGYRGTGRNITEEMEARQTVDRLIGALDQLDVIVALFDADERLLFANARYRSWVDAPDVLCPGVRMEDMLHSLAERGFFADPELEIPERMRLFRNPTGPVEILRNGNWFHVRELKLPDGGHILIASDITQRKVQELELLRAKDEAERANAAKTSFLARMSHELRTPLNAILGLSDMILTLGTHVAEEKRREYVSDIRDAGGILLSHIEDILDFARLEAGVYRVSPRSLDIRIGVARSLRVLRPIARKRNVRLRVDLPRGLPSACVDPRALEQIVINLTANAITYSNSGRRILIAARDLGSGIELRIADQGRGMPAADLPRVFEPFFQVGEADLSRESGTGLGLAIVKGLVDKSDGSIDIESTLGIGTTVRVVLPRADRPAPVEHDAGVPVA